jgi:hypothetical protein
MYRLLIAILLIVVAGCEGRTDRKQRQATEKLVAEADRQVGMPGIANFTERKFARQILELRDSKVSTYTYIVDWQGRLHFVCNSIGFGLPYSVQFTNPERLVHQSRDVTLPQPDPNGLFMPDGLSATWILCDDGEGGVSPIYSEPSLLVSPFRLTASGESYAP